MQLTIKHLWIGAGIIALLLVLIFWPMKKVITVASTSSTSSTSTPTQALPLSAYKTTTLTMAGHAFTAEISDTEALQELGLSYRTSIDQGGDGVSAMLFEFDTPSQYQFWMKDMSFPLDIIWLDASKHVIYISKNLSPSTYPASFGPTGDSQYVIEVAAGTADRIGLKVGDTVTF